MAPLHHSPALERLTRLLVAGADEEVLDRILLDALRSLDVAREAVLVRVHADGGTHVVCGDREAPAFLRATESFSRDLGELGPEFVIVGERPSPGDEGIVAVLDQPRDDAAVEEVATLLELCARCRDDSAQAVELPLAALPATPVPSGERELANDLRNHLAGLRTVCDVLHTLGDELEEEEREHYGAVLARECRRAGELLALAIEPELPPACTGDELLLTLNDVVESERASCELENARLELRLERGVEQLEFRLGQIDFSRVLRNLLVNAREASASPAGPTAEVLVECHPDHAGRTGLVLSVTDDGPGVPPELRPRLFQAGASSKRNADSGCGLSAVRALVTDAGGEVSVQHLPLRGTRFTVWLPGRAKCADGAS